MFICTNIFLTELYHDFIRFVSVYQPIYLNIGQKNYNNQEMSTQVIYGDIINRIRRIYQTYQDRANQMAVENGKKGGNKADKLEEDFLKGLNEIEKYMAQTVGEMKKEEKGARTQFIENIRGVEDCQKDIRSILKKRPLNFKVNPQIKQIIDDTKISLDAIRADLRHLKETKFLCCGTDGAKKFKTPMNHFKVVAGKWRMLTLFESKDGLQTFINPKFNEGDFHFIGEIIKKHWPKEVVQRQIIEVPKEIIREVEVIREVPVSNGIAKPSPLNRANEYIYGINRQQNLTEGFDIYHQEADRNNPQACCFLGKIYEEGVLLPQDYKKAIEYYKVAIKGKENYASYRYALGLIKGKFSKAGQNKQDIEEAFKILSQIANDTQNPCPEALTELGQIYQFGSFQDDKTGLFTIKKDINKAILYYTKARKLKLPRASNNLGVLYLNSKLNEKEGKSEMTHSAQNDKNIINYLVQAQEAGFSQAYYNLGVLYSKGLLGQRNSQQALKMFYEGSLKGDYKCKIKFAYELMNQTSVMKEQYEDHYHLAIQWLEGVVRKLSRFENSSHHVSEQLLKSEKGQALFYLGLFHQHGFGVEKSPKKAINYFIEASGLDYPAAKNKIGDCYFSGYGLKLDRQLAVGCYLQAAELGNSDAMVNLGTVYLNGIPNLVQKNYKKAYDNFYNATQQQNSDAMIHLSNMYKNGLGVDQNEEVARELLQNAAQLKNATALYMLRQQGIPFNQGILFEHLQNEFFSSPKKIDLKQIVPVLCTQFKTK